jgi:hypothetical protein
MAGDFAAGIQEARAMPSPFPGMNPYLEQADVWTDFHASYIVALRDALRPQLDPRYIVKIEEQLYIHEPTAEARRLHGKADVVAVPSGVATSRKRAAVVLDAPTQVTLPGSDVERLSRVEIRDRASRQLITAIELLSPANKYAGEDREQYLAKRGEVLASLAHFVEIDLLRGGPRMPLIGSPECDYCVLVSRAEKRPEAGLWPLLLRDPLPVIPIPVSSLDPDARLDLGPLLHRCYDSAGYQTYIYQGTPSPALSAKDAAWAEQVLKPIRKKRKA